MKSMKFITCLLLLGLTNTLIGAKESTLKLDTVYADFNKDFKMYVTPRHDYTKTYVTKLFMCSSGFDGRFKRRDNGSQKLYMNCEQALEIIKGMDEITMGMPKVVYLVGWQYLGHDSKYPAFFEGNEAIKRPQDSNALESLKWLMAEAKKYNTSVSVHINMIDAYEDSPLWDKYVANNVIARTETGALRGGEWGYPISYAQEWKLGFTQERIDKLCEILPIQEAGTIHIDAYHSAVPNPIKKENGEWDIEMQSPISPFLDFTQEDEIKAQRNIIKYFDSKGIDVTTEGVPQGKLLGIFDGYQTMGWWFKGEDLYLKYTANQICGGCDHYSDWGKLFGTNLNAEQIFMKGHGSDTFAEFKMKFCTMTLIFNYLNRFDRLYRVEGENYKAVQFSNGVHTELFNGRFILRKGKTILVEDNDVCIPAQWLGENKNLILYSEKGYKKRTWKLPDSFPEEGSVTLYEVTENGKKRIGVKKISNQKITIGLKANEMLLVEFKKQ